MSMLLFLARPRTASLSSNPEACVMESILFLVSALMPGLPFSTLDTVLAETPAILAIS